VFWGGKMSKPIVNFPIASEDCCNRDNIEDILEVRIKTDFLDFKVNVTNSEARTLIYNILSILREQDLEKGLINERFKGLVGVEK
jgi:hypothetical protein